MDSVAHSTTNYPVPQPAVSPSRRFHVLEISGLNLENDSPMEKEMDEQGQKYLDKKSSFSATGRVASINTAEKYQKSAKAVVPNELLLSHSNYKSVSCKGEQSSDLTKDMLVKTKNTINTEKNECNVERHHSDGARHNAYCEMTFKRSASSPNQLEVHGANVYKTITATMDNLCSALSDDCDETSMDRKESAESGFEEQAANSDTGTLEKRKKLQGDPTSVSDLSEVGSDDVLGALAVSQVSNKGGNLSSPSDRASEMSESTLLQLESEPLLEDTSSSLSSSSSEDIDIDELTHEMIFERSLSDSGGMSPVYHKEVRGLSASKSAEKFFYRKPILHIHGINDQQNVRVSRSQENYVGNGFTFVDIDLDDTTYSLDQIPTTLDTPDTPTTECTEPFGSIVSRPVECTTSYASAVKQSSFQTSVQSNESHDSKCFVPGFITLDNRSLNEKRDLNNVAIAYDRSVNSEESSTEMSHESQGDGADSTDDPDGAIVDTEDISADYNDPEDNNEYDQDEDADCVLVIQEGLFALPATKSVDLPSAQRLAKRLYNLDGFRKSDVARHLCKKNDFSITVAEEYLKFFDFTGNTLDVALRKFLRQFSLIGETQERERVLAHFSRHFMTSNPGTYNSEDACHTLVCAIMLLNTDLHGQAVGRKMACAEFIENLTDLNDGENFPKDVLKAIYHAIKAEPIEWAPDDSIPEPEQGPVLDPIVSSLPNLPAAIGGNPFLDIPDPENTTAYKKGYIMRKCCVDPDGRKTAVGKRAWKMFYAVLRDMILYLYKDEQALKKSGNMGSHNAIRAHHCYATKATDYSKKQHVFRLRTADWAEYLFQTSNTKECEEWINVMNFIAASLSAPPLPGAVGSQKKFQRPLLPATYTRLTMADQLICFEEHLSQTELDLQEHRQFPPEKGSKASMIQHYIEKETYLTFEIDRLKEYCYLLKAKLQAQSQERLDASLVETTIGEDEEGINKSKRLATVSAANVVGLKRGPVQRSASDRLCCFRESTSYNTLV
ncbi:uncharacterized protein LOC127868524 isoform X2 [Dreissena polymorpha]|uniref:PH and SEC7 domain-containing protein 3 n=1 Tax=Dreissena polymorpha TaxID=45954 RepID=A0A9D4RLA0_DREPO|nr:uncharacterized protein LOC127868524 isoform X2 [Dreissena polymorpha]XP_052266330.1 uncharacterized protein LOC127868524 isoform X2 [Dreissena polymorpha]KAH3871558.1 hypothetical protein DPMN_034763 [Dreissena polymorpha]